MKSRKPAKGRKVVVHNNLLGDAKNMGAVYINEDVVVDGDLVTGRKKGREAAAEITMTANLGLAIDDMAVAPLLFAAPRKWASGPGCRCESDRLFGGLIHN